MPAAGKKLKPQHRLQYGILVHDVAVRRNQNKNLESYANENEMRRTRMMGRSHDDENDERNTNNQMVTELLPLKKKTSKWKEAMMAKRMAL